jgi:uncharacterized phiE125 gp8 family phage protein
MIEVVTAPTVELVTLTEAKAHLRVDDSASDTYITSLIKRARMYAEHEAGRSFGTQTLKSTLPKLADPMPLPRGPIVSVTSVTYLDTADARQTLSSALYYIDRSDLEPVVRRVPGVSWPSESLRAGGVEITYVAGTWAVVPEGAVQYILLLIGTMYEQREADVERAAMRHQFADRLLDAARVPVL